MVIGAMHQIVLIVIHVRMAQHAEIVRIQQRVVPQVQIILAKSKLVLMVFGGLLPVVPITIRAAVHRLAVRFARMVRQVVLPGQIILERLKPVPMVNGEQKRIVQIVIRVRMIQPAVIVRIQPIAVRQEQII